MEKFLHYIWRYKLYAATELTSVCGKKIRVIDTGMYNTDAGPDFFNAKLQIDDTMWVGDVEVHTRASDWERHKHETNPAYDSVVLHVVNHSDREVFNSQGCKLLQVELQCSDRMLQQVEFYLHPASDRPCATQLDQLSPLLLTAFKNRLLVERLEQKTNDVFHLITLTTGGWEEVLYIRLLRALGMGINGDAFERLARSLPFALIRKYADSVFRLESLLLGQAGLADPHSSNTYEVSLAREFDYLRHKHQLTPLHRSVWKMLRLRPSNFPHLRLAQVAALYHASQSLFGQVKESLTEQQLTALLSVAPSDYWREHYSFNPDKHRHSGKLGRQTLDTIIINAIIPVVFAYGREVGDDLLCERTYTWLDAIVAENNTVVRRWREVGVSAESAADSQALLQLYREYCQKKRCLFCQIGHKLLQNTR